MDFDGESDDCEDYEDLMRTGFVIPGRVGETKKGDHF